jgi:sialic acid synthase SpsE
LTARKPAIGIPVAEIETVLGKPLKRNVARDEFLHPSDLDMEALA